MTIDASRGRSRMPVAEKPFDPGPPAAGVPRASGPGSTLSGDATTETETTRWVPETSSRWRLATTEDGDRRCRYGLGRGRGTCGRLAVAAVNRQKRRMDSIAVEDSWWFYCEDHLYGRRVALALELQRPADDALEVV